MENEHIIQSGLLEVIFENRHKNYGAYAIRQQYDSRLKTAMFTTISIAFMLVLTIVFLNRFYPEKIAGIIDSIPDGARHRTLEFQPSVFRLPSSAMDNTNVPPRIVDRPSLHPRVAMATHSAPATSLASGPISTQVGLRPGTISEPPPTIIIQPQIVAPKDYAEVMPQFPGGESEMLRFIQSHIVYPERALNQDLMGAVYVQFTVQTNGKIDDIHLLKDIGGGCGNEAMRVVSMMPIWIPGKQSGNPVAVYVRLPIRFSIAK